MPAPLVPQEVDLAKLDGFMLDTIRLLGSELWALATGDEFKAAMALWCRAWQQVPAASLPDDDRILASFAGYGRGGKAWQRVKSTALRGFIKCSDGRLYHRVLAKDAVKAWREHQEFEAVRAADRERLKRWRQGTRNGDGNRNETVSETLDETPDETAAKRDRQDETEQDWNKKSGKEIPDWQTASSGPRTNGFLKRMNGGADYSDPAKRKARWEQKIAAELHRRLPGPAAEAIIRAYRFGTPDERKNAKDAFEMVDTELKARKTGAGKSTGAAP
ncbi:MAG: DUF1376 domain-containing protein [Alphaproteobacteria bacterium]